MSKSTVVVNDFIDIKDKDNDSATFNLDKESSIFIGGGKSDARDIVSQEFADITGGTRINVAEARELLSELLNDGVDGVELDFSNGGFSFIIDGAQNTKDTINFTGNIQGDFIDIKDKDNDFATFDLDTESSIFIGGGKSDARNLVSQEFADITGGTRINVAEAKELLDELLHGGVDGVELLDISKCGFSVAIDGSRGTQDVINFTGSSLFDGFRTFINIKDKSSRVGVFDVDFSDGNSTRKTNKSFTLGGGADDKSLVSDEFNDLVKGSALLESELQTIYGILDGGGSIENVAFAYNNGAEDFAITLTNNRGAVDTIVVI